MVTLPNFDVFQNPIENFSLLGKRRFDLPLRIEAGPDLEMARQTTLLALQGIDCLSKEEEPTFFAGVE